MGIRTLTRETTIYSIGTIASKFLNWLMVPLYTYILDGSADYGVITNLYSWTILLLVLLTYGFETGFLRFVNEQHAKFSVVYSTALKTLSFTSFLFALSCILFSQPIANISGYHTHPEYISILGVVVAMDAFCAIPFAYLRYKNKSVRFVAINTLSVLINIVCNVFFLIICPWLSEQKPELVQWFYNSKNNVEYVFISNLISTTILTLTLYPEISEITAEFDPKLLKCMFSYSLPLVLPGIAGVMNQTIDKILFPYLFPGIEGSAQLGIYGATSKIALVIVMFSQSFLNSYEPMVFAEKNNENRLRTYAESMKLYVIAVLFVYLGMVLYMDILQYLIREDYRPGLKIVPVIMLSYILQGIYFNHSIWYKLTNKTWYAAVFAVIGIGILIVGNVLLVPLFSYYGSAWSAVVCFFIILLLSYHYGQKQLAVKYDLKTMILYGGITGMLIIFSNIVKTPYFTINILINTVLMAAFLVLLIKRDLPLRKIPIIGRYF